MDKYIYGIYLDSDGRCIHYYTKLYIVALKLVKIFNSIMILMVITVIMVSMAALVTMIGQTMTFK